MADHVRGDRRKVALYEHIDEKGIAQIKQFDGSEAYEQALLKEPPKKFTKQTCFLYFACLIGFFCSTANGFDGAMFNTLLEMDSFLNYFNIGQAGTWAGIVTSMYQIGGVCSLPFIGPGIDNWGRRMGMTIGSIFIAGGTIIQSASASHPSKAVGMFMCGRFFLGFGVNFVASAGPVYVVEISHPAHRGFMTGLYNCFWFVGSITATAVGRGSLQYSGNKPWELVVWMQLFYSGLILLFVWFLPESPRWLYVHGKVEKASQMITKYHGLGKPDSVWVSMQLNEYEEYLELDGSDKRWWDYRGLFKTRSSRYRMMCNIMVSIFGQWAGNGVLTYYQGAVLDTAGIKDQTQQLNVNLGISCSSFAVAVIGALCVDRLGRRSLLLFTNLACCLCWVALTISSSMYAARGGTSDKNEPAPPAAIVPGTATLAFMYIFNLVYSFGYTPLQALYPVEILSFEMRAKGMGFSGLAVCIGNLINQFAWPIALANIQWRTYIIFCIWCFIQFSCIYFVIPETRNRTLEELDEIFNAPNPRKFSTMKKNIAFDANDNIVGVERI